jgi:hypothetical protein
MKRFAACCAPGAVFSSEPVLSEDLGVFVAVETPQAARKCLLAGWIHKSPGAARSTNEAPAVS